MKTKNLILSAVALLSVFVAVNVCAENRMEKHKSLNIN